MPIIVQRLRPSARDSLAAHFLALPADDRRLRFGSSLSAESIVAYVDRIDFERDAVFAVDDDRLAIIGAAHLAFTDDVAELGLSVLPPQRGHGIGSALFERAATHARNRFVSRLFMHCLVENTAIMHLARKAGMSIAIDTSDADACLELPAASPASLAEELLTNGVAQYDHAIKTQAVAWHRIHAALLDVVTPDSDRDAAGPSLPRSSRATPGARGRATCRSRGGDRA